MTLIAEPSLWAEESMIPQPAATGTSVEAPQYPTVVDFSI